MAKLKATFGGHQGAGKAVKLKAQTPGAPLKYSARDANAAGSFVRSANSRVSSAKRDLASFSDPHNKALMPDDARQIGSKAAKAAVARIATKAHNEFAAAKARVPEARAHAAKNVTHHAGAGFKAGVKPKAPTTAVQTGKKGGKFTLVNGKKRYVK